MGSPLLAAAAFGTVAGVATAAIFAGPVHPSAVPQRRAPALAFERVPTLRPGLAARLPRADSAGRQIPAGRVVLVLLPACGTCSAESLDPARLAAASRWPVVFLVPDGKAQEWRARLGAKAARTWLVSGRDAARAVPLLDAGPDACLLGPDRRVLRAWDGRTPLAQAVGGWR